ncbi:MAG: hypothetical protein ABI599_07820 [Flavobacteriales bacterium]
MEPGHWYELTRADGTTLIFKFNTTDANGVLLCEGLDGESILAPLSKEIAELEDLGTEKPTE